MNKREGSKTERYRRERKCNKEESERKEIRERGKREICVRERRERKSVCEERENRERKV